jgi:DNA-directed RNA polymerase subunit K/omega
LTTASAAGGAPRAPQRIPGGNPLQNRLLVSSVAFLRARQLHSGSRPRVEGDGHKTTHLAVLEVLADTISWSIPEPVEPA